MKAIIPIAGVGTRLRPHTYTTPKALLKVAGKPVISYLLDKIKELGIKDVVLIVSEGQEKVKEYIDKSYDFKTSYVIQKEQLGLGHAIYLARETVGKDKCLIIYGDTIFFDNIPTHVSCDAAIGVKRVKDPKRFGIVELEGKRIKKLVEKPEHPTSNLSVAGVNVINNSSLLFSSLEELINNNIKTKGEFQLTDAFQLMVDKGGILETFPIKEWYDCGKVETLLSSNKSLLEKTKKQGNKETRKQENIIIEPVSIHPSSKIKASIIGPYVSIDENCIIEQSIIRNSIIGENVSIKDAILEESIIGDNAVVYGKFGHLNVGDSAEVGI